MKIKVPFPIMVADMSLLAAHVDKANPPDSGMVNLYILREPVSRTGRGDKIQFVPVSVDDLIPMGVAIDAYICAIHYDDGHIDVVGRDTNSVSSSSASPDPQREIATETVVPIMLALGDAELMLALMRTLNVEENKFLLTSYTQELPPTAEYVAVMDYCLDRIDENVREELVRHMIKITKPAD